jgi:hypothetical protein
MSRRSGSMSGRWKRSRACGSEPRRGNPDTRTYRRLNHRATSRLYSVPAARWQPYFLSGFSRFNTQSVEPFFALNSVGILSPRQRVRVSPSIL